MPAHEPVAVGEPAHLAGGRIGLVGDLPDDLLDDVLDRHDADDAAVLVDDDRHRGALALQVGEQVVQRLGLGHDQRVVDDRLDRRVRPLLHQLAGELVSVHEAADAVAVFVLGDEQARVAAETHSAQRGLDVLGDVDRDDRRDRRHHLARLLLVQVEDAREHPRLARVDLPARLGLGDQALELIGGAAAALDAHVDAEQPQHPVGDGGQRDDERAEERR